TVDARVGLRRTASARAARANYGAETGETRTPSPLAAARRSAAQPCWPTARSDVPCAGEDPGMPLGARNLILGLTNRINSALGAKRCHHGADVRSGERNSISVGEELFQPRDDAVARPEWRVHPHEARPGRR